MTEKTKPEKGYVRFFSKKDGLKIVLKPAKMYKDKHGNPVKEAGSYIKFVQGTYRTNDKEKIEILNKHMVEFKQDGITLVDETKLTREQEIRERVEAEMAREDAEKAAAERGENIARSTRPVDVPELKEFDDTEAMERDKAVSDKKLKEESERQKAKKKEEKTAKK